MDLLPHPPPIHPPTATRHGQTIRHSAPNSLHFTLPRQLPRLPRPYPGQYWNKLFSFHPRSTGICTLLVGGRKTHILFSPPAVRDLFKARTASRDVFERDLFSKVFEFPDDQIRNAEHGKHLEFEMNSRYLIKRERVDELTAHFTAFLDQALDQQQQDDNAGGSSAAAEGEEEMVPLYAWLRDRMFTASTRALMGDHLLQMYPGYREDFYKFDTRFLSFFFGLPRFLMGDAFEVRDRIFRNLERWSLEMHRLSGGKPVDPVSEIVSFVYMLGYMGSASSPTWGVQGRLCDTFEVTSLT